MFWQKKSLDERLKGGYREWSNLRYTYRIDNDPFNSLVQHGAYGRLLDVCYEIRDGAPVRETLVKNFQGELLKLLLKAAGESRPSRQEYGRDKWAG